MKEILLKYNKTYSRATGITVIHENHNTNLFLKLKILNLEIQENSYIKARKYTQICRDLFTRKTIVKSTSILKFFNLKNIIFV